MEGHQFSYTTGTFHATINHEKTPSLLHCHALSQQSVTVVTPRVMFIPIPPVRRRQALHPFFHIVIYLILFIPLIEPSRSFVVNWMAEKVWVRGSQGNEAKFKMD